MPPRSMSTGAKELAETAILLANGLFETSWAKTAHGLVRGPSRYTILGVVDPSCAGTDAGELLDGRRRDIPVVSSVAEMLDNLAPPPDFCVVGIATEGGVIPAEFRVSLLEAAVAGVSLVSGLHRFLADDAEIAAAAEASGARILDIRKPRPTPDLHFWEGSIRRVRAPRVAVLGTDCGLGKRTTTALLLTSLRGAGIKAETIYTGQTGWLSGQQHGFILDATLNDFVSGELERVIVDCDREHQPDVILLEGQSALRNPSGPCGSELIISGAASGVVLQHAPGRVAFDGLEEMGALIPPLQEEIELVRLLGSRVLALTLNHEGLTAPQCDELRAELADRFDLPVAFPLLDGVERITRALVSHLDDLRTD